MVRHSMKSGNTAQFLKCYVLEVSAAVQIVDLFTKWLYKEKFTKSSTIIMGR